jgi:uncharacterized protein
MDCKRNRRKRHFIEAGVLVLGSVLAATVLAEIKPTPVTLGSATKGGGFQLYGEAITEVINKTDSSLRVEARATKGSKENLPLLESEKLDVGLVEGNAAFQAFDGIGRSPTKLRIISAMYPNPGMFVVRGDVPYRSIEDLKGKRIAWGTQASGLRILANEVMDGLGLDPNRDFQPVILKTAAEGPLLVLEGRVAALWGGGIGWPGFKKVAGGSWGARFIAPNADEIRRIRSKHKHLKTMTVPAGTYAGQKEPIESVGLWAFILARPSLSDELAYRLARALHLGEVELGKRLPQAGYTTAKNTVEQAPQPELIHPGAARYLREIGLMR